MEPSSQPESTVETGPQAVTHVELAGRLSASFRAGMRPLALGTGLVVALSAPVADFLLERGDLGRRANARAREVSQRVTERARIGLAAADLTGAARSEEDVLQAELIGPAGEQLLTTPARSAGAWPIIWGSAPVQLPGDRAGTIRVAVTEPELIGRDLFLLTVFGALGLALTLALYFFPLRLFREEDLVRLFARRSIKAVEQERLRLSRELHDGAGQSMGAAAIALARLKARLGPSPEASEGAALVDEALQELRRVTQGLRPSALDDLGLGPAIEALGSEATDAGLRVTIEVPPLPRLSAELEHTCYRLAQEALTNVSRHAAAKNVRVSLRQATTSLILEVEDDGRGFLPASQLGLGLVGARERAAVIGGTLTVESKPGAGARFRAVLPLSLKRTLTGEGRAWADAQEKPS